MTDALKYFSQLASIGTTVAVNGNPSISGIFSQ